MAGFSQCGGIALALSQWMVHGAPDDDVFAMDIARFGEFATNAYTRALSLQFYESRFAVPYPNEAWPAGRPLKTTPIYELQRAAGAVFAPTATLETPMWFARPGEHPVDIPSFDRPNSFAATGEEVAATTSGVGLADISSFSKFAISGPGVREWLDHLLASRIPTPGRCRLGVMTSDSGRIIGDFTVMCMADDQFVLTGSGPMQWWHLRWFDRYLPAKGVTVRNVTDELASLAVIGPGSRNLLAELTRSDVSNEAFRLLAVRDMEVALAPARVARLSLTGELGYEVYVAPTYLHHVYTAIRDVGARHGLRDVGALAMLSMRLEKGIGIWGREFSPDYTPAMNSMHRFVDRTKPSFIGRDRVLADLDTAPARRLVTLEVEATRCDVSGFEPVYCNGRAVGYTTSGGFGHRLGASLAMAYVDASTIDPAQHFTVPLFGDHRPARLAADSPFDPSGLRMRS
jgi:dimethylglycine dehydrogenase